MSDYKSIRDALKQSINEMFVTKDTLEDAYEYCESFVAGAGSRPASFTTAMVIGIYHNAVIKAVSDMTLQMEADQYAQEQVAVAEAEGLLTGEQIIEQGEEIGDED